MSAILPPLFLMAIVALVFALERNSRAYNRMAAELRLGRKNTASTISEMERGADQRHAQLILSIADLTAALERPTGATEVERAA